MAHIAPHNVLDHTMTGYGAKGRPGIPKEPLYGDLGGTPHLPPARKHLDAIVLRGIVRGGNHGGGNAISP